MSSITVQFLISVISVPTCDQAPLFLPFTGCQEVRVNVQMTVNIYVVNSCPSSGIGIADMIISEGSDGMNLSTLHQSSTNASLYYKTLTWTPQANQLGMQQLCVTAYTR